MAKHSKYKGLLLPANDYSQDIKDFGANVRKYRETQGLSLDALSDLIDSDKSSVSKLENGDRTPKYDTVLKLADALQITPAMLSPNRFSDAKGAIALSQIHERLMKLPVEQRVIAATYICAMLEGLIMRNKGNESSRQNVDKKDVSR